MHLFCHSSRNMGGPTPTVNISGLKSVGLGTLGGGGGPGAPASEGEALVSWVTLPFFVSGLLASRRKPHFCWLQGFSLPPKNKTKHVWTQEQVLKAVNVQTDIFGRCTE